MIAALVLAAGAGERMGGPKALVELGGVTFLERVVRTCAQAALDEIVVVAGAEAERVEAAAAVLEGDVPLRVVRNERWREGRTGSVQAAWASCAPDAHGLVFPVDHPCVRVQTLDAMLGAFGYAARDLDVLVPVVSIGGGRRRGHPVILAASVREAALALRPDEPLRDLVRRSRILELPVDDEGILLDIDAPGDLARALDLT